MKDSRIIANTPDCFIELIHRPSSPTVWIVRRWKKTWWFKKRISSNWFNDGEQALSFATRLKLEYDMDAGTNAAQEELPYAQ